MKAKKSLGQNFFVNKNLCERIAKTILLDSPDIIVEIGPGTGTFTQYFYNSNSETLLVEKDDELATNLESTFPSSKIVNIDFLDWNLEELEPYYKDKITFFGSLPYNVSKLIIKKIISSRYFNNTSYFIIQKEVAEKYIAREPENNLLSLQSQLFAKSKRILNISPESFRPRPKVNSSLISFIPENKPQELDLNSFNRFLILAFTQPRKTLANNLRNVKFKDEEEIKILLSKRAQHLSLKEYLFLFSNTIDLLI